VASAVVTQNVSTNIWSHNCTANYEDWRSSSWAVAPRSRQAGTFILPWWRLPGRRDRHAVRIDDVEES
jgi:hypothetical protein